MPSLPPIRTSVLEELASQLRFAPPKTIERQIEAIEKIAAEIEPDQNYPEDWLEFRITGYRSEREDPALLVGAAVLADLSALAEHLAAEAKLARDGAPKGAIGIEDLCARWNVSRKTIERYRRRGLIARRVMDAQGHVSLVFAASVVEAFEKRNQALLDRAKSFTRIDARDRAEMLREVQSEVRAGRAPTSAVKDVSARHRRSSAAVRQAVRGQSSDVHDVAAMFHSPLDEKQRAELARAFERGEPTGELARRFGRTAASVQRIANEARGEYLRGVVLPALCAMSLEEKERDEKCLEAPEACAGLDVRPILTAAEFVVWARAAPPPALKRERALGLALGTLLSRARRMIEELRESAPSSETLDRIETDLRWATQIKRTLVWMHLPLVVRSVEERLARPMMDLPPKEIQRAVEAGVDALVGAVDRFDALRGGRLAAGASIAINRAMATVMGRVPEAPAPTQARRLHAQPVELTDWTRRVHLWQSALELDARLAEALKRLPERDRGVLEKRYGLTGEFPRTCAELKHWEGVSVQRIRGVMRRVWAEAQRIRH